jgi:hypothetical protein
MSEPTILAAEPKGFCRHCGKSLTAATLREVRGAFYCEDCLAQSMARPAAPSADGNPTLAAVLGFVPGLGAVYNGEYVKGFIHVVIFALLIAGADHAHGGGEAFFGLMIAAFVLYMPIEAYRTAKAKMLGQKPESFLGESLTGLPVGPIVLIVAGVLFLGNNLFPGLFDQVFKLWPVILIAIGIALLRKRMGPSTSSEGMRNEQRN